MNSLVENRTQALIKQNEKLVKHAFINAHKVRSPLARIGLVHLIKYEVGLEEKGRELVDRLQHSTDELNDILREVRVNLEGEIIPPDLLPNNQALL